MTLRGQERRTNKRGFLHPGPLGRMRLTKLKPFGGFCAETGAAAMLFLASGLGIPVSTTHTITGGIVGVGLLRRPSSFRWGVALRIVWAWVFTIQSAALIARCRVFPAPRRRHVTVIGSGPTLLIDEACPECRVNTL